MATGTEKRQILSVSRRSDIPAHHLDWFMASVEHGEAFVEHPYTRTTQAIPLTPESVHTLVFWTKDIGPFLKKDCDRILREKGFHLYFNITINSESPILEPGVPPLNERLESLGELCRRVGPNAVTWRFDPICHFLDTHGHRRDNLHDAPRIAHHAAEAGIRRCITSFVDLYPKVVRRARAAGIELTELPIHEKVAVVLRLNRQLQHLGIDLFTCCENDLQAALPFGSGVTPAACIPGPLLASLYGGGISLARDPGQRRDAGCRCTKSRDIGSYTRHPCPTNCLYCYARPVNAPYPHTSGASQSLAGCARKKDDNSR